MDNNHDYMSKAEAVGILLRLAASRKRTEDEITALQMGARRLLNKHCQQARNHARRRAGTTATPAMTPAVTHPEAFVKVSEDFAELSALINYRPARHESLRNSSIFANIEIGDNGGNITRSGYLFAIDDETRKSKRSAEGDIAALVKMLREGFEDDGEAVYTTPPAALDVVAGDRPLDALLQNPPFDAATPAETDTKTEDAE